jgi:hypothetical protein
MRRTENTVSDLILVTASVPASRPSDSRNKFAAAPDRPSR